MIKKIQQYICDRIQEYLINKIFGNSSGESNPSFVVQGNDNNITFVQGNYVNVVTGQKEALLDFAEQKKLKFSFENNNRLIHPLIVKSLQTQLCDTDPIHMSVNLYGAMRANQFHHPVEERNGWFIVNQKDKESFGYKFIGKTKEGIHILHTWDWGGGSGVFNNLVFLEFSSKKIITNIDDYKKGDAIILSILGEMSLGDRFDGTVDLIENDTLIINGTSKARKFENHSITLTSVDFNTVLKN